MQTSITQTKIKALLQACLSNPVNLQKTRKDMVIDAAIAQGFKKEEAIELSCKIMTLWTALDLTIEQFAENCMKAI